MWLNNLNKYITWVLRKFNLDLNIYVFLIISTHLFCKVNEGSGLWIIFRNYLKVTKLIFILSIARTRTVRYNCYSTTCHGSSVAHTSITLENSWNWPHLGKLEYRNIVMRNHNSYFKVIFRVLIKLFESPYIRLFTSLCTRTSYFHPAGNSLSAGAYFQSPWRF